MRTLRALFVRFGGLFRRKRYEVDVNAELQAHLDGLTERNIAAGMPRDEARFAALREFGGVAQIAERARDERRSLWGEQVWQDIRYAARQLRKHPGFAAIVVLILGLGIGANMAVFSALEVLMFRALPVPAPDELVVVSKVRTGPKGPVSDVYLSTAVFDDLHERASSLAGVLMQNGSGGTRALSMPGAAAATDPVRVKTSDVSGGYFAVLRVTPLLGRLLMPEDDRKGGARAVAVISHAFWQRQFGGDRGVVGKTVLIEKVPFEIIGVAPEGFAGVKAGEPIEVWTPLWMLPTVNPRFGRNLASPNWGGLFILGRLRPGVTRAAAEAEIDLLYQQTMIGTRPEVAPDERAKAWGRMTLQPGAKGVAGDARRQGGPILGILLAVVVLVQVIACANVASLSLARLATRRRELAARTAMGASRGRIVRQLLTEALLLVAGGAVVGGLFVLWGFLAVRGYGIETRPNGWILLFGFLLLLVTGTVTALMPALKSSRIDLATALKSQGNTLAAGRSRLQQALVVIQLAVCGCLLMGTGYFVRTLQHLRGVDVGFQGGNLLLVNLETPSDYDARRRTAVVKEVLEALKTAPGINRATYSVTGLLTGGTSQGPIAVGGYVPEKNEDMTMRYAFAGPEFFETIGLPLVRGRGLDAADVFSPTQGATTKAVVNEAMARRFFGDADPIGRRFTWGSSDDYEIVGVVRNAKYRDLREENPPICYLPWPTFPSPMVALQVRTAAEPRALIGSLPAILRQVNPGLRIAGIRTMDDVMTQATREERTTAIGVGAFSALALLLTSLGLYGLLAYQVTQRTREIGVRLALGGRAGNIIVLILKQGLTLVLVGWLAGIAAALGLARLIASRLYGVASADPMVLIGSGAVLAVVAALACWLPARRATRVDPMVALRAE